MSVTTPVARLDLRSQVSHALARTPHFMTGNVRFEIHDDEVVLQGVVGSYYQKQLAQESVRVVAGVGRVRNQLEVAPAITIPM